MRIWLEKTFLFVFILFFIMAIAENVSAFQSQTANVAQLRRVFAAAVSQDFEIVRDEMRHRPRDTAGDYWLVYVKPKRSGYYSLKYSYRFIRKWSENSSEEGENEFFIGVGGKECYRRNQLESGISSYCLGDTIIIPILTANLTKHAFSLKFNPQKPENLAETQKYLKSREKYSPVEPVFNQLKSNVKLLGTKRFEMSHRRCCAVTIEYYAVFEAIKPGRFNLVFSTFEGDEIPASSIKMNAEGGTPIIIVAPGKPITALLPYEKTIHYADKRRFSAHAGNNFITNLLILQPGDVFALQYSRKTLDYMIGAKISGDLKIPEIKPAIYKLPFLLDKDWSFNEWLIDVLPKD